MTRPIPDLLLERYLLKELPEPDARAIADESAGNPAVQARLEALTRSDEEIRARYPPARFVRRGVSRRQSPRTWVLAGALATAVVTMLSVMPSGLDGIKGTPGGRPSLAIYRRTPAGSERLADGDVARAGDLLRVGYAPAGRTYGVILSIDGRGAVTLHLPPSGDAAVPLGQEKINLLDRAYELDDAPRIERFYFVTGTTPFKIAPVLAAARAASARTASSRTASSRTAAAPDRLSLPSSLEQTTVAIQKGK